MFNAEDQFLSFCNSDLDVSIFDAVLGLCEFFAAPTNRNMAETNASYKRPMSSNEAYELERPASARLSRSSSRAVSVVETQASVHEEATAQSLIASSAT